MAILPLQNFTTMVQNMVVGVQGAASALLDLTVGSVLRATLEASASVGLWIQFLILQVLAVTRLASSTGTDVDSFVADFGLQRLPASPATTTVTFSRFTPGSAAIVPVGTPVLSTDGTVTFTTSVQLTIAAGVVSGSVGAVAATLGTAGNVQAGTLTQVGGSGIAFVDTVTNLAAATNGLDPESDAALRARFVSYINSRSEGTTQAINFAISSLQQGLRWAVIDQTNAGLVATPGSFLVVVDDGTGTPPTSLITAALEAVELVRPLGVSCAVQPPVVVPVAITLTATTNPASAHQTVANEITAAETAYANALPIGSGPVMSRVIRLADGADASIVEITNVTLNGVAADVAVPINGVTVVASIVVS